MCATSVETNQTVEIASFETALSGNSLWSSHESDHAGPEGSDFSRYGSAGCTRRLRDDLQDLQEATVHTARVWRVVAVVISRSRRPLPRARLDLYYSSPAWGRF